MYYYFMDFFSNKNNKININAVVTSVRGIIVTYSYEYNGKTYIKSEEATKIVKVGDLYPIIIDKNGEISTAFPDVIENILMTILVFLSILFMVFLIIQIGISLLLRYYFV